MSFVPNVASIEMAADAPSSFLMDLTTSPNMKTAKGERVGAHSLAHNTLGVEGHVGAPR